ncbi:MAG: 2,3-bisphosphoglycerate-independent phosphoglycerate mutase, partial [Candidatus Diapherotrites archaeon]|nr:2,3-bisphosphoglycerate-independent phosphoglycerate mutase [Candidatus Diapherotrites archaeon]
VETVDECVGKLVSAAIENGYVALVTADHGSAEEKRFPDGQPKPSHSSNPVPCILAGTTEYTLSPGGLSQIAPSVLELMGITQPKEMTAHSLLQPTGTPARKSRNS